MPHTLRAIDGKDETIAELEMIARFGDDLAVEATRVANRLHGLLPQRPPRTWCSDRPIAPPTGGQGPGAEEELGQPQGHSDGDERGARKFMPVQNTVGPRSCRGESGA
ncbi:transposase [Streptomyces sp. NPDC056519]|uniref:IS110 family transposase n=1 Tax=Streptomyces sp. NPDC056519 TaxID=3345849 RepID=UPI00367E4248